jgi:hypothetical protein
MSSTASSPTLPPTSSPAPSSGSKKRKCLNSPSSKDDTAVEENVTYTGKWFFINIVEPDYRSYWASGIPKALHPLFRSIHGCSGLNDVLWEDESHVITVDDALELLGSDVGQYVREDGINYEEDECESLNELLNKLQAHTQSKQIEWHEDMLNSMHSGLAYSEEVLDAEMGDRMMFYRGESQMATL